MIFPETFPQLWGSMLRTPRSRTALAAHQVSRLGFWNRRDTYSLTPIPIPVRSQAFRLGWVRHTPSVLVLK